MKYYFDIIDEDGSGTIDKKEMMAFLRMMQNKYDVDFRKPNQTKIQMSLGTFDCLKKDCHKD